MAEFLLMHTNNGLHHQTNILSTEAVLEMNTVQYPDLDSTQGLVWYRWDFNGETIFGHNGGDYGVSTEIGFTEDGRGFVILVNAAGDQYILPNIEEALLNAANALTD